jgi:hypothetical protein
MNVKVWSENAYVRNAHVAAGRWALGERQFMGETVSLADSRAFQSGIRQQPTLSRHPSGCLHQRDSTLS